MADPRPAPLIRRQDRWPLGAIGFIVAVTVAWWGFALWRIPGAPEWLERARSVCFNLTESGVPDAKGWLLLLGQPPAMIAALVVGWSAEVRGSLRHLVASPRGIGITAALSLTLVAGASATLARVADARSVGVALASAPTPSTYPRLDRPWPRLAGLVDQTGDDFTGERLRGRVVFVTFAFAHCETVCPLVVHAARSVRNGLDRDASIVVFTLDPWRDTPSRLPSFLAQLELDPDRDFVVSGAVESVEAALDAWNIARERDARTGDVVHPAVVYLVEPDGTVAYAATGGPEQLTALAGRLR